MCLIARTLGERLVLFILLVFLCLLFPFQTWGHGQTSREMVIVAINDVYRIQGLDNGQRGGISLLRTLRRQLEQQNSNVLLLHAGDFLFPSLLSEWDNGAHMIEAMNALDGAPGVFDSHMFVGFGNHEFEKTTWPDANLLQARIDQSEFQWLNANIQFVQKEDSALIASDKLHASRILESGGIRIGIFGLTTDKKPAKEIAYVNEFIDPVGMAREQTEQLREQGAEVVIALTHLPLEKDKEMLEELGELGPDLIIGGHEHQRHHVEVDGRWILKADADARTATVVCIRMLGAKPFVSFGYRFLSSRDLAPDPFMQEKVDRILAEHEAWYCSKHNEKDGCFQHSVGQTAVPLNGEELDIRRYETNLGNWVADQMRAVIPHTDIAFLNSGALRVNQTIPVGPITRRQLEELFQYDSELVVAELPADQLDAILEHAAKEWVGQGHWLQVSGLAFKHDPQKSEGHRVDNVQLFQNGQLQSLPDRPLQLVTNKFLIEGGDGYDMLKSLKWVSVEPSLKNRIKKVLVAHKGPIQPKVDGRICNSLEPTYRPCAFNARPIP